MTKVVTSKELTRNVLNDFMALSGSVSKFLSGFDVTKYSLIALTSPDLNKSRPSMSAEAMSDLSVSVISDGEVGADDSFDCIELFLLYTKYAEPKTMISMIAIMIYFLFMSIL
jgi:hypothetical protein